MIRNFGEKLRSKISDISEIHPKIIVILSVLSFLIFMIPPVLIPSTILSLSVLIYALIVLILKRVKVTTLYVVGVILCLSCFMWTGITTAGLLNSSEDLVCQHYMHVIYCDIYNANRYGVSADGQFDLADNNSIIPSEISFRKYNEKHHLDHFIFSVIHQRKYLAINRNIAGKRLKDFKDNGNVIMIALTDNDQGYFWHLSQRQIADQISDGNPPMLISGKFAEFDVIP